MKKILLIAILFTTILIYIIFIVSLSELISVPILLLIVLLVGSKYLLLHDPYFVNFSHSQSKIYFLFANIFSIVSFITMVIKIVFTKEIEFDLLYWIKTLLLIVFGISALYYIYKNTKRMVVLKNYKKH